MVMMHVNDETNRKLSGVSTRVTSKMCERNRSRADAGVRHRGSILEILLDCTENSSPNIKSPDPIWTAEASHRALNLLRLILSTKDRSARNGVKSNDFMMEYKLAQSLVDTYRLLNIDNESGPCSCEEIIQASIRGLLAAFQTTIGMVEVKIRTLALNLPTHKRRALTLLLSELVVGMLLDKSERGADGRLTLSFSRAGSDQMNIKMETSCPLPRSFNSPGYDIVCALSGIVGAEILYSAAQAGGTSVELLIPLEKKIWTGSDFGRPEFASRPSNMRYSR
jgi:hypothetical protein